MIDEECNLSRHSAIHERQHKKWDVKATDVDLPEPVDSIILCFQLLGWGSLDYLARRANQTQLGNAKIERRHYLKIRFCKFPALELVHQNYRLH
jgi:hypothetical protein